MVARRMKGQRGSSEVSLLEKESSMGMIDRQWGCDVASDLLGSRPHADAAQPWTHRKAGRILGLRMLHHNTSAPATRGELVWVGMRLEKAAIKEGGSL